MVGKAGEDGLFLGRSDDHILAKKDWQIASAMTDKLINFANQAKYIGGSTTSTNVGDISIEFNLPDVKDSKEFLKAIQSDKVIQKAIRAAAFDSAMGKNSLGINKLK